jgi:hypothetical protein
MGVVRRVYDADLERARKCAKEPVLSCFFYNRENAMKLSILAAMLLMWSCAAARTRPVEPWSVSVTSSGGLAGKGAGSYSINSNREVSVTTMTGKTCSFPASDATMAQFNAILTKAKPEAWGTSYIPEDACCDRFEYELTLDEAGTKHTVKWIDDPLAMPADLKALTDAMVGGDPSLRVTYGAMCR